MNIKKIIIYPVTICLLILIFANCKKEENIVGMDLQPGSDILKLIISDTSTIFAYAQKEDKLASNNTSLSLLGYVSDPIFGKSQASLYSQFRLSVNNLDFGTGAEIDSLVLSLSYDGFFGDTLKPFIIKVYELNEALETSKTYYNTSTVGYNATNLTETPLFYCYPKPNSSTKDSLQSKPVVRIPLQKDFGRTKFIAKSGRLELANNEAFLNYFKGLYICAENVNGIGSMIYVNMPDANSCLTLYYHNDEKKGLKHNFIIKDSSAYFYSVDHFNYADVHPSLKKQIIDLDYSETDKLLYLQASAGVKTLISFPFIKESFKDKKVAIHKAELVITRSDDDYSIFHQPTTLDMYYKEDTSTTTAYYLPDFLMGTDFFGGGYNTHKKEYRFRITQYIQNIIMGKSENYPLHLVVKGAAIRANRLVFYGTNPNDIKNRLRLEITYSLINE